MATSSLQIYDPNRKGAQSRGDPISAGLDPGSSGGQYMFAPRQYHSYSGTDMLAVLHMPIHSINDMLKSGVTYERALSYTQRAANIKIFAELATLSMSSARSVHPVRRLGESHVYDYTRGARTVAGTMVFALLDRDVFAEVYRDNPMEVQGAAPFFVDQIPKFNIYMAGSNEYGGQGAEALTGITLTNVGKTWSVDDIYTEVTYTYVAQFWYPFVADYNAFNRLMQVQEEEESKMRAASRILLPNGGRAESVDKREEAEVDRAIQEAENILLSLGN